MKRALLYSLVALTLSATSCAKKEAPKPVVKPTATKVPFTPNSDGKVSVLQAKFWIKANKALDSLAEVYASKLSDTTASTYTDDYNSYKTDRDAVCKKNGISGEYKEYLWITKNITRSINKPVLDSVNLKTF